jgi:homoserine dehydrogenase
VKKERSVTTTYRLILSGLGNVHRSLLGILRSQETLLRDRYGAAFQIVGVADSGGSAVDQNGLDVETLLRTKQAGRSIASLEGIGRPGLSSIELVRHIEADVLMEATPVNLQTGQPGLDTVRLAFDRGMHVVIANKGPVALAYAEFAEKSDIGSGARAGSSKPQLRFSACVGGAMPTINIGQRDMRGCRIERFEAVLNGTTQIILRAMEQGGSFADALQDAQQRGLAETDPTLDVEGWDAANKLVIFTNAVLGQRATLDDVEVIGITRLTADDLRSAMARDSRVVLLCLAAFDGQRYQLSVRPTALPLDHPLARMSGDEMGLVFHTDIAGRLSVQTLERGPEPTAAAMLRDLVDIVSS